MEHIYLYLILAVVFAFAAFNLRTPSSKARLNLPPGPKPLPVIGNVLDLPKPGSLEFEQWLKHKDTYGPISSVSVMGTTIVIVHDKDIAHALLEKRAGKTALEPETCFADEMCGYEMFMGSNKDSGVQLRRRHKLMLRHLTTKSKVDELSETLMTGVDRFLFHVLNEPDGLREKFRT